ncbi:MAG: hypothetical protein E7160_02840 [Firmicutes bacterium]|nr:hypothetical protein [Bacillota bacterium]
MDELKKKQKNFFDVISKIIQFNKLSHSYLIEVNSYDDDIKYIKEFIKMILLNISDLKNSSLSEDQLKICNLIDNDNYPDLKIIESDGQWIKKSQLIELKDEYQNKSLLDNKRIYVIKDADKLNASSANTILKFLEEPEENIIAILITNNRYKVLDTILSRCQILTLEKENSDLDVDNQILELLKFIINGNDLFVHYKYITENLLLDKEAAREKILCLEKILINYLNCKLVSGEGFNNEVCLLLENVEISKITKIISIIENEISNLVYNVNYKIWLDSIFAKFVEV